MRSVSIATALLAACALAGPAALAAPPAPVSPAGPVERGCPTFSWSAVPGAAGYELVVYEVRGEAGAEVAEEPLLTARLPAGAAVWTPPATDCLAPGGSYAWALRVVTPDEASGGANGWSEAALFEVAPAPAADDVAAAIRTLRRHLEREGEGGELLSRAVQVPPRPDGPGFGDDGPGAENVTPAAVPSLGSPSLSVSANVALAAESNVFKDGTPFLWDDTEGNTVFGRHALESATGTVTNTTAVGWEALQNTVEGGAAYQGARNTAAGFRALKANTTGFRNTATGSGALYVNTTGYDNTASGGRALFSNTTGTGNTATGGQGLYHNTTGGLNTSCGDLTLNYNVSGSGNTAHGPFALGATDGSRNTGLGVGALQNSTSGADSVAIGYGAGQYTEAEVNDTIIILNSGRNNLVDTGSTTIRIGTEGIQDGTFVAGVRGTTTAVADAVDVVVDSAGQLGTVSSSRAVKQDISDAGELSRRLLDLRPVAFRYRAHAAVDPDTPLWFGLVAEEVADVFPELAVRDAEGRPETVKYQQLPPLLLAEMQRLHRTLGERRAELDGLRDRLDALGGERPPPRSPDARTPWWRRLFGSRAGPE